MQCVVSASPTRCPGAGVVDTKSGERKGEGDRRKREQPKSTNPFYLTGYAFNNGLPQPSYDYCCRMLTCRPLRCADVPAYDSISDSPIHGLSFRPIPMVVGSLMLKRWIVQNDTFHPIVSDALFWTIHRFNMRAPTTMGIGRNESPCIGLSDILSYEGTYAHRSGLQVNILPYHCDVVGRLIE